MRTITKIEAETPVLHQRKRVAAYARVSMETERLQHSLSAQVSYYNDRIQKNPDWLFAGVYADNGISGTGTAKRENFNRLIADCEAGRIDMVLTKSISRFARNTVDLLETVRHLKELGVEVWFERENIRSMSGDGELMLSILASFAQEESRSISENVKWGTRKRFERGIPNGHFCVYGYRWEDDHLVVEPEEAKIVKLIFDNFQAGLSAESTEKQLEEMGVKSYKGMHFSNSSIRQILSNITYTGNLLFQKEYCVDPISGKSRVNRGELPQYFVENTHEAIIPMEVYLAVQEERHRRRELGIFANWSIRTSCFTSKIKCGNCGKSYRRSGKRRCKDANEVYYVWICQTKNAKGTKACGAKIIPEKTLKAVCAEMLGQEAFDESAFSEKVEKVTVIGDDTLVFHLYDGTEMTRKWKSTAKKDCWTDERKREWSERHKAKSTNPNRHSFHAFTGLIKCARCGENYRSQGRRWKDGTLVRDWHCGKNCGGISIRDAVLKDMVCDVLEMDEFIEERMDKTLEKITVDGDVITFVFLDGHSVSREYVKPQKPGIRHTSEYKEHMRQIMKEKWTPERRKAVSERMKRLRKGEPERWQGK